MGYWFNPRTLTRPPRPSERAFYEFVGEDEAMCVTDNLFSMEGKASFWSIISDTCPLAVFRVMLT